MISSVNSGSEIPQSTAAPAQPAADANERIGFWALFGSPDPPQSTPQPGGTPPDAYGPSDKQLGFWALFNPPVPAADPAPAPAATPGVTSVAVPTPESSTLPAPATPPSAPAPETSRPTNSSANFDVAAAYRAIRQSVFRFQIPTEEVKF